MKPVETLAKLEALGHALFETRDLAALLGVADSSADQSRDSFEQFRRNHQAGARKVGNDAKRQSAAIPEHLASPFPAYVSLQSALYYHGMISQIPAVTYAVSLARTRTTTLR